MYEEVVVNFQVPFVPVLSNHILNLRLQPLYYTLTLTLTLLSVPIRTQVSIFVFYQTPPS